MLNAQPLQKTKKTKHKKTPKTKQKHLQLYNVLQIASDVGNREFFYELNLRWYGTPPYYDVLHIK